MVHAYANERLGDQYVAYSTRTNALKVTAELRELKVDISELGRSLDGSSIGFAIRQRDLDLARSTTASLGTDLRSPAIHTGISCPPPSWRNRSGQDPEQTAIEEERRSPFETLYRKAGGSDSWGRETPRSSDGSRDDNGADASSWPLPPPPSPTPPPSPPQPSRFPIHPAAHATATTTTTVAAASCGRWGVRRGYGGVDDVSQLARRLEATARAVSRENEDIIKRIRNEEDKTFWLRNALWQEGAVKREWEMTTEASRVLKQRLESTERIRKRQKELIRELQAVEADLAFADAGGVGGSFSPGPLPDLSPPLSPPPPPPLPARGESKDFHSSPMSRRRDRASKGEKVAEGERNDPRGCDRQQQSRQRRNRRPRSAGPRSAGKAAARFERESRRMVDGESSVRSGVVQRGPPSARRSAVVAESRRRVDGRAVGTAKQSSNARRARTPTGEESFAAAALLSDRRQRGRGGGKSSGGGGGSGGSDFGRWQRTRNVSLASGRKIAGRNTAWAGIDRPAEASAAPFAASRSSLRFGVHESARRIRPPPAAVATFGAPTAASLGKERRREGMVTRGMRPGSTRRGDEENRGRGRRPEVCSSFRPEETATAAAPAPVDDTRTRTCTRRSPKPPPHVANVLARQP